MDWKTIRIPEEDFERHNDRRKELGETWAEYIDGAQPDEVSKDASIDAEALREIVREETRRAIEEVAR